MLPREPARDIRQRDLDQLRRGLDLRSDPIEAKLRDPIAVRQDGWVALGMFERWVHERESSKTPPPRNGGVAGDGGQWRGF